MVVGVEELVNKSWQNPRVQQGKQDCSLLTLLPLSKPDGGAYTGESLLLCTQARAAVKYIYLCS